MGSSSTPPGPTYSEPSSASDYSSMLVPMMMSMQATMANMTQQQNDSMMNMMLLTSQAPASSATPAIDWEEEDAKIRKKMALQADADNKGKVGRAQTVLTSPLTENPVSTTSSVLTGE